MDALQQLAKTLFLYEAGATIDESGLFVGDILSRYRINKLVEDFLAYFGQNFFARNSRDISQVFSRGFIGTFDPRYLLEFLEACRVTFGRHVILGVQERWWHDVEKFVGQFGRDMVRYIAMFDSISVVLRDHGDTSTICGNWRPTFEELEEASVVGRSFVRSVLASDLLGPIDAPTSELGLFRLACRASLNPAKDSSQLDAALAGYHGDPLWPALARHLSRRSTAEDRALLEDLARHPEKREGVLSWCLRYYVRGDLLLQDGTVLTIDDLCQQIGIEPPPLLEDMPDELPLPDLTEPDSPAGLQD
jgi:hypothetical protein